MANFALRDAHPTVSARRAVLLLVIVIEWLSGCATQRPVPVVQRSTPADSTPPSRSSPPPAKAPSLPDYEPPSSLSEPGRTAPEMPAVLALMEEAEASSSSGDFENAASGLERAIRIQPRNARLWHDLAKIRLAQGQGALAEDLARKSTVLAAGDERLLADNQALIAEARRRQGDETPEESTGD